MELRALKTFIVSAEKMNFTQAAEQLGYTQAAVSIQIKQLEEELETPLFNRIGRNVYLTEKGREFLSRAQYIIRYTEDSVSLITEKNTRIRCDPNWYFRIYIIFIISENREAVSQKISGSSD